MSTVICQHCETENVVGSSTCIACGSPLAGDGSTICPNCQALNEADAPNCVECGTPIIPNLVAPSDPMRSGPLSERESPADDLSQLEDERDESVWDEETDLDAWLGELTETLSADPSQASPRAEADSADMSRESQSQIGVAPGYETGELLDWLAGLEPETESDPTGDAGVEGPVPRAESPERPAPDVAPSSTAEPDDAADMTDWLADVSARPSPALVPEESGDSYAEPEEPAHESPDDLLSSSKPVTKPLGSTRELEGVPEQLARTDLPEWLDDLTPPTLETEDGAVSEERTANDHGLPAALDEFDADVKTPWSESDQRATLPSREGLADQHQIEPFEMEDEVSQGLTEPMILPDSGSGEADVPDWLRALKPEKLGAAARYEPEELLQKSGPLAGLGGVIRIETIIAEPMLNGPESKAAHDESTQRHVAMLEQLTQSIPQEVFRPDLISAGSSSAGLRLLLGLILLALIAVGWLLPALGINVPGAKEASPTEPSQAFFSALDSAAGQVVLVAFEYSPAMAGELDAVAETLLAQLATGGSQVVTVSQSAAGIGKANQITERVEGLRSQSLGFIPGEAMGLRRLSGCLQMSDDCQTVLGREIDEDLLVDLGLIVVLTAERDSLVNWIEQVGTQVDMPLLVGSTQSLAPVVAPYLVSEQIAGSLEGLPETVAYQRELLGNQEYATNQIAALAMAQWLAIIVIIAGALYYGLGRSAQAIGGT